MNKTCMKNDFAIHIANGVNILQKKKKKIRLTQAAQTLAINVFI